MDKILNTGLINVPNFLLVLFSLSIVILISHLFITQGSN